MRAISTLPAAMRWRPTALTITRGTSAGATSTSGCATAASRAAKVALSFARVGQALGEPRELEVHGARVLERQARLKEAPCLAPELGLRAQAPERGKQLRIAAMRGEPALGALDAKPCLLLTLGRRQGRRQLRV